ncbi:hypothetical protein HF086_007646 [Spodoptera exigua]|uniref:THAP-type domain-containing protein n=1 Tax=Spodoptera exigua TaxID=7107 RepID=A0A922MB74_SPOEX|nr:hypothetical protein HF086_007646 [Spodoptera exigua]
MPYYCTVPRCTSMAGKVKNVSFHQFPKDEELAKLWNDILKRGKPYTKYSKVCSLHFKPEDYTITSTGKNKGIPPVPQPQEANSASSPIQEEPDSQPSQAPNPLRPDIYNTSYQCMDCSKCFKDPDVFAIHKRTHKDPETTNEVQSKEIYLQGIFSRNS